MAEKMAQRRLDPKKVDNSVIDLQKIIEKYIWSVAYTNEVGKLKAFFTNKRRYKVDIKWPFLDIKHSTKEKIRNESDDQVLTDDNRRKKDHLKAQGKPVSLQKSHYKNNTKKLQKFAFSCKRQTKASTTFSFQETYSIGGSVQVEVKIPGDVCSVSAGADGKFTITEQETQSFEDTLAWDVNSEIYVKAGEIMDASLIVREKTTVADIKVTSKITMKEGKLPYVIRKKSDNKILLAGELISLAAPFESHKQFYKTRMNFAQDGKSMTLKSRGTCKSVSWLQQDIDIKSSCNSTNDDDDEEIIGAPIGGDDDDGDDDDENDNNIIDDDDDDDDDDKDDDDDDDDDKDDDKDDDEDGDKNNGDI